jgi:hypothetical protein
MSPKSGFGFDSETSGMNNANNQADKKIYLD